MTNRPIDDRRRQVFLEVLRETGSMSAAASAATPHSDGGKEPNRAGYRSFLDLMKRDPGFAAEVEEAKNHALGIVEQTIFERAMSPQQVPIFSRGVVVGYRQEQRDANVLLLRVAERLSDDWSPKKHLKGEVAHKHLHAHLAVTIEPRHLDLLAADERDQLVQLLILIEERSNETQRLPDAGASQDALVLPGHTDAHDHERGRPGVGPDATTTEHRGVPDADEPERVDRLGTNP